MTELFGDSQSVALIALIVLWVLPWKGFALWKAARLSHKGWFIALFLINSLAILEIIYIFFIASKYRIESEEIEESGEGSGMANKADEA